jgi:hypothetical protein
MSSYATRSVNGYEIIHFTKPAAINDLLFIKIPHISADIEESEAKRNERASI